MNTDDIIDALNEVDDTCIKNAKEPKKKKNYKALWISVGAVAACLAMVLLLPRISHMIQHDALCDCSDHQITPTPVVGASYRDYKPFGMYTRDEMIGWGWDRLTTAERFSYFNYNDVDYLLKKNVFEEEMTVSPSFIREKLADITAEGTDWRTKTDYTMGCSLYEIAGVDPTRYLAVQYTGDENAGNFYVFARLDAPIPATLGDFIAALNPSETLPLTMFEYSTYDEKKEKKTTRTYGLSPEDSKVVWDMISEYASAKTKTDNNHRSLTEWITVYTSPEDASSAASGHSRKFFSLADDGYLTTNIEKYSYHFYLGEEAVTEIQDYILSHKTKAPEDSITSLYGVVTEIGEDYIKIDDTILMKNPEEGIEYTISTHDMHVKRHIIDERIKVGSHVKILHRDSSTENPTEVQTAFSLEKGGFVFEEEDVAEDDPNEPTPTPEPRTLRSH